MPHHVTSYLHRNRHDTYYFRRAVPRVLRPVLQRREIYRSLGTSDRRTAAGRAVHVLSRVDRFFRELEEMVKKSGPNLRQELIVKLDLCEDTGKPRSVEVTAEPHEEEFAKRLAPVVLQAAMGVVQPAVKDPPPATKASLATAIQRYCSGQREWTPASRNDIQGDLLQIASLLGDSNEVLAPTSFSGDSHLSRESAAHHLLRAAPPAFRVSRKRLPARSSGRGTR